MEPASQLETNIFHLPEEILFKIMNMAGCCLNANHDIRLVCRHFYKVYCRFTSCGLRVDSSNIGDNVFDSMMHSLRRPSRFVIENHEYCSKASMFNKIVERFAVHIRKLQFCHDHENIKLTDFESIMRSMINVEEATFVELNIYGNSKKLATNPIQMPSLKKLILINCDTESVDIILCVKASLLEEFYVNVPTDDVLDFTQFFNNHKTIKHVAISGKLQNPQAFKHLQLSKLQIYNDGNVLILRDVIANQPKLKYLNLLPDQEVPYDDWFEEDEDENAKIRVNDELFTAICTLKELELLRIGFGQVTPKVMGKIAGLMNLKEVVINAVGEDPDFDNDYDYDVNKMRDDVHFQKCFQKLIVTPLPKLESFTWSFKDCEMDDEYFMSDDEELMQHALQREYSSLSKVDLIKAMAPSFPKLKYLKIEMKSSSDINVREILKTFPYLETLQLKISSTFKGEPISMHDNIKHVEVNDIENKFLIEFMRTMPNLESLEIRNSQFSLDKNFLRNMQSAVPNSLKELKLKFNSHRREEFAVENVVILQDIIKKLQKCRVKLTGNCDFDTLAEKIDRSVGVSLPRSPKWYVPGDGDDYESYMQLWKGNY